MHSNPIPRRRHSAEFKAKVLAACNEPGASVAAVALAHGLNANLVRTWLGGRGLKRTRVAAPAAAFVAPPTAASLFAPSARFLPLEVAPAPPGPPARAAPSTLDAVPAPIHIELHRGPLCLSVHWPVSAAADCVAWLVELTPGLLK